MRDDRSFINLLAGDSSKRGTFVGEAKEHCRQGFDERSLISYSPFDSYTVGGRRALPKPNFKKSYQENRQAFPCSKQKSFHSWLFESKKP
jgi:hypothetical protein